MLQVFDLSFKVDLPRKALSHWNDFQRNTISLKIVQFDISFKVTELWRIMNILTILAVLPTKFLIQEFSQGQIS